MIGSTTFRSNLSLESLTKSFLSNNLLKNYLIYFLQSPESKHIVYTSMILEMIDLGITDFRYGFDYLRFFIYPLKSMFGEWSLASYNEFPILISGIHTNSGIYLGLSGELFWNFGYLWFLFIFIYGYLLKIFTNFCFCNGFSFFILNFFFNIE